MLNIFSGSHGLAVAYGTVWKKNKLEGSVNNSVLKLGRQQNHHDTPACPFAVCKKCSQTRHKAIHHL